MTFKGKASKATPLKALPLPLQCKSQEAWGVGFELENNGVANNTWRPLHQPARVGCIYQSMMQAVTWLKSTFHSYLIANCSIFTFVQLWGLLCLYNCTLHSAIIFKQIDLQTILVLCDVILSRSDSYSEIGTAMLAPLGFNFAHLLLG